MFSERTDISTFGLDLERNAEPFAYDKRRQKGMATTTRNEGGNASPRRRRSRAGAKMNQEKWFTVGDGAIYLGITDKSLRKYLNELHIKPVPHTGDQRMKYYSQTQLNQVADAKGLIPGQKPPTMKSLALEVRNLRHEMEELRQALEAIRKQMETDHAQLALPPLPPTRPMRAAPQHPEVPLALFVTRHISPPMDPARAIEEALRQWSQPKDQARIRSAVNLHYRDRRHLVERWVGKAGYHQCVEDNACPCHGVLQKLPGPE